MSEIDSIKNHPIVNWDNANENVVGRVLYLILQDYDGDEATDNASSPGDVWVGGGSGENSCSVMDGVNAALETIDHAIELTFENAHPHTDEIRALVEEKFKTSFDNFYDDVIFGDFVSLQLENEMVMHVLNYGRFNYVGDEWSELVDDAKENGYDNSYSSIEEFISCEAGRYILKDYESICEILPSFDLFKYGGGDKRYEDFLNLVLENRDVLLDY